MFLHSDMKLIFLKTLLIASSILFVVSSCKKYEEDEKTYYKTPCGRVVKKWKLYKITDKNGNDYKDSLFYFRIPDNGWALKPEQSFTYNGLILELERSNNKMCLETGIRGNATILNQPFSSGYYELIYKRKMFKFDVRPHEKTPTRYFINDYKIYKMTSTELIFGRSQEKVYFKVAD